MCDLRVLHALAHQLRDLSFAAHQPERGVGVRMRQRLPPSLQLLGHLDHRNDRIEQPGVVLGERSDPAAAEADPEHEAVGDDDPTDHRARVNAPVGVKPGQAIILRLLRRHADGSLNRPPDQSVRLDLAHGQHEGVLLGPRMAHHLHGGAAEGVGHVDGATVSVQRPDYREQQLALEARDGWGGETDLRHVRKQPPRHCCLLAPRILIELRRL
jgi:hypothetical protein